MHDLGGVIGGVIGALALILLALFFLRRRHNRIQSKRSSGVRQTDLLDQPESPHVRSLYTDDDLQPEPYIVPPSDQGHATTSGYRPSGEMSEHRQSMLSVTSTTPISRSATPVASSSNDASSRKSPHGPPQPRVVNFIQHDDAGSVEDLTRGNEPETVELPPRYTSIRRPEDV